MNIILALRVRQAIMSFTVLYKMTVSCHLHQSNACMAVGTKCLLTHSTITGYVGVPLHTHSTITGYVGVPLHTHSTITGYVGVPLHTHSTITGYVGVPLLILCFLLAKLTYTQFKCFCVIVHVIINYRQSDNRSPPVSRVLTSDQQFYPADKWVKISKPAHHWNSYDIKFPTPYYQLTHCLCINRYTAPDESTQVWPSSCHHQLQRLPANL